MKQMPDITHRDLIICASLARECQNIRWTLQQMRAMAEACTSDTSKDGITGKGTTSDRVGNIASALSDMEAEYEPRLLAYFEHVSAVQTLINGLAEPRHRTVLWLRYVNGMRWEEVAEKANYTDRWCYVLHDEALELLGIEKEPQGVGETVHGNSPCTHDIVQV